jgi:hypothetical protein
MVANSLSKRSLRSSSAGVADAVRASNSAYDSSTALGVLCLVITTAPLSAACSKTVPNSFLRRLAATMGTSTSLPSRLRNGTVDMVLPSFVICTPAILAVLSILCEWDILCRPGAGDPTLAGRPPFAVPHHRRYRDRVLRDPAVTIALFDNTQYIARPV